MNYYCKAIEQGYEEAREWMEQLQKNLVDETITDIEIPQDKSDEELYKDAKNALEKAQFKTAYAYFSYLTQRNHAESFNELGDMYFYGRGMSTKPKLWNCIKKPLHSIVFMVSLMSDSYIGTDPKKYKIPNKHYNI